MIKFKNENEFTMEADGVVFDVKAIQKENQFGPSGPVRTRVYVWFEKDSEFKERFDWKNSDPDELVNKIYRARHKWQKQYVVKPLVEHLAFGNPGMKDVKISFSSKAGCSCGCSPGFIISADRQPPFDLFVHIH